MPTVSLIPQTSRTEPGHDLNAELQTFLEAFMLMELGAVSKELSKIA